MDDNASTIQFPTKLTPRASKILQHASAVAQGVGAHDFIGVEHIFLAIMDDEDSIPTQVLRRLEVADPVRGELLAILRSEAYHSRTSRPG